MSSTITITCQYDTYLDASNPNSDLSNQSLLKSKRWYEGDTISFVPIIQFNIPNAIKYAKILSARVNYTMQQVDNIDTIFGAHIRAFSAKEIVVSSIRYSNYNTLGSFTEPLVIEDKVILSTVGGGYPSAYSTSADITSLLQNNIINDIFTIAINLRCNYPDTRIRGYGSTSPITLTIDYENVYPDAPTILYPVDVYLNQDSEVTFKWAYNTESGAKQNKYEIDWKKSGDNVWTNLVTGTGINNSYTARANTFPVTLIDWRCRTTDELGQVSEYSYAKFVIKGKPPAPAITEVKNDALTEIYWNSSDQVMYEIELLKNGLRLDYIKASLSERYYLPDMFLADGTYEFRIRIMNSFNLWSDFTSRIFTITTTKPNKANIKVSLNADKTTITSDRAGYLYRIEEGNDILIHIFEDEGTYVDNEIRHGIRTGYFVRTYSNGYSDSDIQYLNAKIEGFIISNSEVSVNLNKSEEKYMSFHERIGKSKLLINYSGRSYPLEEVGEFETLEITRTCFITEREYMKLKRIYYGASPIVYRDDRGRRITCSMSEPTIVNTFLNLGYNIDITFTKLEENEVKLR